MIEAKIIPTGERMEAHMKGKEFYHLVEAYETIQEEIP